MCGGNRRKQNYQKFVMEFGGFRVFDKMKKILRFFF